MADVGFVNVGDDLEAVEVNDLDEDRGGEAGGDGLALLLGEGDDGAADGGADVALVELGFLVGDLGLSLAVGPRRRRRRRAA